jgi:hypothetical protein
MTRQAMPPSADKSATPIGMNSQQREEPRPECADRRQQHVVHRLRRRLQLGLTPATFHGSPGRII